MVPETAHMETATLLRDGHCFVFNFLDTEKGREELVDVMLNLQDDPDWSWTYEDSSTVAARVYWKPAIDELPTTI